MLNVVSQHHLMKDLTATQPDKPEDHILELHNQLDEEEAYESSSSGADLLTKGEGSLRWSKLKAGLGVGRVCLPQC